MSILIECVSMHHMHVWCPERPEEDTGFLETGGTDS